jgi:hypothetical protein
VSSLTNRIEDHRNALRITLGLLRSGRAQAAAEALELLIGGLSEPIRVARLREGLDVVRKLRA